MRGFDISILLYVISNFSTNYLKANFIFCLTKSQAPLYERGWGCVFAVLRKRSCLSFVDCSCDFARVSGWSGSSRTAKHYKNTSKRATREAPFACYVFVCFCGRDYKRKTRPVESLGFVRWKVLDRGKGHAQMMIFENILSKNSLNFYKIIQNRFFILIFEV